MNRFEQSPIQRIDVFNIRFYHDSPFYGSYCGMNYRIEGVSGEDGEKRLCVTTWPGPYNFANTADEVKVSATFDYSNDGLTDVVAYLNRYHTDHFR